MHITLLFAIDQSFMNKLLIGSGILVVSYIVLHLILKAIGRDSRYLIPPHFASKIKIPLFFLLASITTKLLPVREYVTQKLAITINGIATILLIIAITWIIIAVLKVIKQRIVTSYDINAENNLRARKIYTQFNILERIAIFIIVIFAVGIALMSFESIRSIGVSMLTSAGVAGIIIGFSAQKALGTLLAGIQIAFTQPIRLDDVVIVEGEWGTIEEITLTYVVIKIWDKRRLIVPTTYFIEKPFQNWTRESSDILGTVFIYTDYKMNVEALRTELTRILNETHLWDKQVNVLQVTNVKTEGIEIRALMSAKDSPTAWDLRVRVREQLVRFIQENYPESIPRSRLLLEKSREY